jgi:hypothetical protein
VGDRFRKVFLSPRRGSGSSAGWIRSAWHTLIFLMTGKTGFFNGPLGAVKGARIPRSSQTLYGECGPRTLVGEENGGGNQPGKFDGGGGSGWFGVCLPITAAALQGRSPGRVLQRRYSPRVGGRRAWVADDGAAGDLSEGSPKAEGRGSGGGDAEVERREGSTLTLRAIRASFKTDFRLNEQV